VHVSSVDELPIGTVTFLFTDIEGSTQLLKQMRDRYGEALEDHQQILREAFVEHGGHEIDTQGDSFFVAFRRAKDAVSAAIECQRRLAEHVWPENTELRVRMGIHTGEPAMGGERYVGLGVHRAARICAAGHGGQVLLSQTARELLRDDPIPDVSLRGLGEHQLKDMDEPERLYQLVAPGLLDVFPELKTAATAPFEGREGELAEAAAEEMARSWRRPSRRVLVGATFTAALVGVTIGVLATQGGGSSAQASVSANAVGVIDPDGGDIAAEIPVGVAPGGVAAGEGAIWVTNTGGNSVSRIDPETNDVRQTIPVGGGPAGIAVARGAAWVANGLDGTVTRIDAATNLPSQTIPVGNGPAGVVYGAGAVWVTNSTDGTVTRIDPATGRREKTLPAIVGASGVAVGFARVWVVSPASGKVAVLDPKSGQVLKEIPVGGDPAAIAVDADAVWVANRADGTVSKIDPGTLRVRGTVQVGRGPAGVAAGGDTVWVTNGDDGTLSHFDPSDVGTVESISLDNPPRGVALAPGGVYVAVGSSGKEHRGGELQVVSSPPDYLDPALAYFPWSVSLLTVTNDGLVGFRKVGGVQGIQLVSDLAVEVPTPTDGGRTYTFQVRSDIHYSNGKLVQPEDFRRALQRVFRLGSPAAFYYAGIVGADRCTKGRPCDLSRGVVTDRVSRTVTIHLDQPDGDLLTKLAMPYAYAVPEGTPVRVATAANPVPATGAYQIAGYDRKTKTYRLVRNPRFRQWSADAQPRGFPDTIAVRTRLGGAPSAGVRAVRRGLADIAPVPDSQLDILVARYPDRTHRNTAFFTEFFFLNTRVAPFDDVRVRRAVSNAFDPQAFAAQEGPLYAPSCQILPPNFPGYRRRTCPYASNRLAGLDRARKLVKTAGVGGARVTVWVPSTLAKRGRYMASFLDSLGFRAEVHEVPVRPDDPTPYFTAVGDSRTKAQIGFGGWIADYPSAAGFIPGMLSCAVFVPNSSKNENPNLAEFCDPSIDAEMTRASVLQALDPPAATLLWQRIERELLAQAPIVPTDNRLDAYFVSERVGNYQYHPQWGVLLSQLWVK
jgi:YVTN family beta-propeller protein